VNKWVKSLESTIPTVESIAEPFLSSSLANLYDSDALYSDSGSDLGKTDFDRYSSTTQQDLQSEIEELEELDEELDEAHEDNEDKEDDEDWDTTERVTTALDVREDTGHDQQSSTWDGFKFVGDNLDRVVKSRFMRQDKQNRSLNYFNMYAVKDRIDLSSLSSYKPEIDTDVDLTRLFPSTNVQSQIFEIMVVLVARVLVEHIPAVRFYFEDAVEYHVNHKYSSEMSQKSEVV
jgi:hypothetical protein